MFRGGPLCREERSVAFRVRSMPEGPEVEVLVRHLAPLLRGRRIVGATTLAARVTRPTGADALSRGLAGAVLGDVSRRGKHLCFELLRDGVPGGLLVGHLGMTGRMYLQSASAGIPRHAAVVVDLDTDRLVFEDSRRFGRLHLDASVLEALGPDPLGEGFTEEFLAGRFRRCRRPVKVRLLDQSVAAGVGNIYACEILFRAGVAPGKPAGTLRSAQVARVHSAVREVLSGAIAAGTGMELDFAGRGDRDGLFYFGRSSGGSGGAGEWFRVYDRDGLPCTVCGTAIRRIVLGGRGTCHCPRCQRT